MTDVHKKVLELLSEYKTRDPWELVDRLGISVIRYPLRKLNGIYFSLEGHKFAAINSRLSVKKQTRVLLHEIGHAVLHPNVNYFSISRRNEVLDSLKVKPDYSPIS